MSSGSEIVSRIYTLQLYTQLPPLTSPLHTSSRFFQLIVWGSVTPVLDTQSFLYITHIKLAACGSTLAVTPKTFFKA